MEGRRGVQINFVVKPQEERSSGKLGNGYFQNNKTGVKQIWSEVVDWIHLAQDRVQWRVLMIAVIRFRVP
jgi:hypothetical protein